MDFLRPRKPSRWARGRRPLQFALVALLSGCASYQRHTLPDAASEAMLAVPAPEALARDARALHHPLLAPVELDFSRPLTPDEITVIAVLASPELRALRAQQQLADAQVFAAGLFPDPQLTLGAERLRSRPDPGLSNGSSVGLAFDLLGALVVRPVERDIVRFEADSVRLDIAWQEWVTAAQARLLAARLANQRRGLALAAQASDAAERLLEGTRAAVDQHDLPGAELEARRIAASDARLRAESMARDAETTRQALNALLGLPPSEQLALADPPPLHPWIAPDPQVLFDAARSTRPDLAALERAHAAQDARVHREVLGQYPRLGIELLRAADTSKVDTLAPAVSLDLPLWNRNRGAIAFAEADRQRLELEYAARLHQARAEIAALVAALARDEAARAASQDDGDTLEPLAEAWAAAARRGDVTQASADDARAATMDHQLALLSHEQSCLEERIALAVASGTPFP